MQRLRAATPSIIASLGVVLSCAALMRFQRWPFLVRSVASSDFVQDSEGAWEHVVEKLQQLFGLGQEQRFFGVVVLLVANAAILALIGLIVGTRERRGLGSALIVTGVVLGWFVIGLESRAWSPWICDGRAQVAEGFGAWTGFILAGWFLFPRGVRPEAVALGTCFAAMITLTVWYAVTAHRALCSEGARAATAPEQPLVALLALLGCCVVTAIVRPHSADLMSSLLVLVCGISLSVPAAAIAHDERVELHPALLASTTGIVAPQTETCRRIELAIVLQITASEAIVSGSVLATSGAFGELEAPLSEVLAENKKSVEDLYAQAGDFDPIRYALNLHANAASMSIPTFAAITRACLRSGFVAVDIVTTPPPGPRIWTRPVTHQHFCATTIELVDDGKPLSEFANWAALVKAADQANGRLKVRVQ